MKKLLLLLSGMLCFFLITGCTSVKRFKSARYVGADNSLVDMDLFGSKLSQTGEMDSGRNLWDLSAGAQTQLIQILDRRYPDNEQFMGSISNSYLDTGMEGFTDLTEKKLRMVFTISKRRDYAAINLPSGRFSPADRIEYLKFSLEIPEAFNLRFTEWNRYTTEYGEVEIADVSFSRSFNLAADGTIDQNAEAGGRGLVSRSEEQSVRSRYLKLNGSISDRIIRVEEEGARDIDLTGNVTADVSLLFQGFPERIALPLFVNQGAEGQGPSHLTGIRFVDVLVPRLEEIPDTIMALLELTYIYRHVQSGWKTYQEWDDRVEYYAGNLTKRVPLFTKKEYLPGFYCIKTDQDSGEALKIRSGNGQSYLLQFKDHGDASRFFSWLDAIPPRPGDPVTIGDNTLLYKGDPLIPFQLKDYEFRVVPVY